ncbi:hypothetical protein CBR_g24214 [Chara braunii]|uniref:Reverse transcriptase domain-containing protein n=1 Tax=Chara braunii TaxID=69332 RepID=A0A388L635_CHABU|nr:hypothetical protein CBR_g24214 [Chara braunii]|eukprot:GBG77766.1 hypothetical protein CBR_g24214 [Chara braunii]
MGICNAPDTFQRAMNVTFQNFFNKTRLTQGMINFCVIVYMDGILVYLETFHGHAQHIEWTLGAVRDAGFKIALEKSEFFLSEISFLGYVVTRGGVRPDSRKVAAVKNASIPTSLTQVRAFLGLASYYRRFIKGFAEIARPPTNLLRKEQPLNWDAECEQAFATLRHALATTPILIRPLTWMRDIEHHAWIEYAELLIVQAWRTEVEGDLLGFLFGSVRPDHRQLIMRELTVPLAQLVDDLSLDIISQCDESPVPYVLSQTLSPYLHWSACLEGQEGDNNQPSQVKYLNPRRIIDISFFQPHTTSKDEVLALEEEEEEDDEEKEQEEDDEEEEEETPEEGSYSEHSEEEQSEKEEEEDQEQEESERENSGEEANCTEVQKEDPKATARRREEIAAGKQPLEYASGTDLPISDGPTKDPEPPKPEDGDLATKTSSALARWRRNRSPSPSTSTRPVVRTCTDAGHRASSPVLIPPSP